MADKTLTAPIAVIKVGGVAVGKMKTIRCTETFRRQKVVGIGRLTAQEMPVLDWNGTLNCSFFMVELRTSPMAGAVRRVAQSVQQWEDMLTLNDQGIQIDILRKVVGSVQLSGIIVPKYEVFASIRGVFANREGWDITENQISGRDIDFDYTTPILFPL